MTDTKTPVVAPKTVKRVTFIGIAGKVEAVKEKTPLASFLYYVDGITQTPDPNGDTFASFTGEFIATNLKTGDIQVAGTATLPTILSAAIEAAKGDFSPQITGETILGVEPNKQGRPTFYMEHVTEPKRRPVLDLFKAWAEVTPEEAAAPASGEAASA